MMELGLEFPTPLGAIRAEILGGLRPVCWIQANRVFGRIAPTATG